MTKTPETEEKDKDEGKDEELSSKKGGKRRSISKLE